MRKLLLILGLTVGFNFAYGFDQELGEWLATFATSIARSDVSQNKPMRTPNNFYALLRSTSAIMDDEVDCLLPWDKTSPNYRTCQLEYTVYKLSYGNLKEGNK